MRRVSKWACEHISVLTSLLNSRKGSCAHCPLTRSASSGLEYLLIHVRVASQFLVGYLWSLVSAAQDCVLDHRSQAIFEDADGFAPLYSLLAADTMTSPDPSPPPGPSPSGGPSAPSVSASLLSFSYLSPVSFSSR